MRTRVKKYKLGSTKPVSQLFLFSNKLNKNIDSYFSGNVVIEIDLTGYDYKYHKETEQVVDFMKIYCKSRGINPYKFLTIVLNYEPLGLTFTTLSGDYYYPIAVHGSEGYKQLDTLHTAYESLTHRLNLFENYSNLTMRYAFIAKKEPLNLPQRSAKALKNQLKKTEQGILKSMSSVIESLHKNFQPRIRR
jgi:hypothetical protein